MTDFDKRLIEKANKISRYEFRDIGMLISIADTDEAKESLRNIRSELRDLVLDTI